MEKEFLWNWLLRSNEFKIYMECGQGWSHRKKHGVQATAPRLVKAAEKGDLFLSILEEEVIQHNSH